MNVQWESSCRCSYASRCRWEIGSKRQIYSTPIEWEWHRRQLPSACHVSTFAPRGPSETGNTRATRMTVLAAPRFKDAFDRHRRRFHHIFRHLHPPRPRLPRRHCPLHRHPGHGPHEHLHLRYCHLHLPTGRHRHPRHQLRPRRNNRCTCLSGPRRLRLPYRCRCIEGIVRSLGS